MKIRSRSKLKACARPIGFAGLAAAILSGPAWAHHSFNAYDMSKTATQVGTIKEFRWGAPHSSMVLVYKDGGKDKTLSVVTGSPLAFAKQGFKPGDFHKGDKVTLVLHPNRNGNPGGAMSGVTLPDGRTYKDTEGNALIIESQRTTAP